ncbi:MAG: FHA domain-containing protein [Verrucomicrobia bacterium]|nr:FHA domain-containing protein [Verrucomicrobiota bacterium]MCH8512777.1 FHA domain-containing protein [Kiritimatiellia bacterium]
MAYLRSLDDQTLIEIEEGENLLIGRMPKCDVVINDPSVSSQHARIQLTHGVLRVIDMHSTNGTRLNYSTLIAPATLLDGDIIEFGSVSFSVDGPELREESDETDAEMDLIPTSKPIDASQRLDATMSISISDEDLADIPEEEYEDDEEGIDEEVVEESEIEVAPELEPVSHETHSPEEEPAESAEDPGEEDEESAEDDIETMDPQTLAMVLSLLFLGIAGLLFFLYLWNLAPPEL